MTLANKLKRMGGLSLGLGLRWAGPTDKIPAEFRALVMLAKEIAADLRANHPDTAEGILQGYLDDADRHVASLPVLSSAVRPPSSAVRPPSSAVRPPSSAGPPGNAVEAFAKRMLTFHPAAMQAVSFAEFYDRLKATLTPKDFQYWTKIKVTRAIPEPFRALNGNANKLFIARARWAV